MRRSTDRILTTHAGSLPRPADLREMWSQKTSAAEDEAALQARLRSAVGEIVLAQKKTGVDIPNDGEFGRPMRAASDRGAWGNYIFDRVSGFGPTPHTTGYGHIYQGRFKSFPIEQDESLLNVLRCVERNALRAKLVDRAQDWRWCSLWRRINGDRESVLSSWPVENPTYWIDWVNGRQTAAELDVLRKSVNRGAPYGSEDWRTRIANVLNLEFTLHPRGRPRKEMR